MLRILYYNYFVKRKKYFENKDNRGEIKYEKKVGYMRADLINITSGTVTDNTSNPTTQTQQTENPENERMIFSLKNDGKSYMLTGFSGFNFTG